MASWSAVKEPRVRALLGAIVQVAQNYHLKPQVTSLVRSSADQARLYQNYLAGRSAYPAAPPGRSSHEKGLAMDLSAADLDWLGAVWESWGGKWGGRFRDPIHFEVTPGMLSRWFR